MHIPGYQIERELGQGGMAIVYLATQESLHRYVALKVIKPVLTTDEEFAQRFLREGRIIAQLSDPHIVTVYDIASHEGNYYLSMEYLPGGTLQQHIRNGLPLADVLSITRVIAAALDYAHRRGIIHRDIKPQNILFRENGQPVLTDFGIAKTLGTSSIMTRTGLSLGTPRYMSPEQIRGQGVDARADIYSLGVLFYEMLTGNVPYTADDSFALAMMHVTSPVPEVPSHLSHFQPLLNKLLEKDPNQRLQSGREVVAAIDAVEAGDFKLHSVLGPAQPISALKARPERGLGWKMGVSAVLAGAALVSGYWFLYRPTTMPTQPSVIATPIALPAAETPSIAAPATLPQIQASVVDTNVQAQQEQQQDARLQAEQFLEQAQRARQDGALQVSLVYIEQGLQAIPDHPGLLRLKQEILQQQADRQRQEEAVRRQAAAEQEKAEVAQRQLRADEFLAQALDEQRRRAYETSLLRIEQGLQQIPDHRRLLVLRQEVRKQLREAQATPPPTPVVKPPVDDNARISALLGECADHLRANRLTVGRGGNAADCYNEVLKLERGNAEALAGIDRIADRYAQLVNAALEESDTRRAKSLLSRMEALDPNYAQLPQLRQQLTLAEAPKSTVVPPSKPKLPPDAPEPQAPVVAPPIDLVSVPQPAEPSVATSLDTRIVAQDRHTRMTKTQVNDDVSLQVTTSPQGLLDEAGRAAVKRQVPLDAPAQLRIRSDIENAEIWINNRNMGTTPMEIEMPPGSYRIRVRQEGHTDWNGRVDLAPGEQSSIMAVLPRKVEVAVVTPPPAPATTPESPRSVVASEPPTREPERQVATLGRQATDCLSGNCENGRGTYRYSDGSEYSGDFRNAKMHGQGTYIYANRGEKYVGEWRNGIINGQGAYYYRSGNRYEGEWRNGRKSGQGVYLYASRGDRYEGQFANDQPNGQGTYYYSNGDRYEGEWRNGRKHGQGVLYEGGQKIVGEWQNDQKVRVRIEQQ
ncbi:MAG: protein kinase [Gammaproteobacteria bacterium]|nr:protein kinase [Gammaproteobacteria bacterium]MCP5196855.1 protein kinase [Gammaproteobacteria bacterium]